MDEYNKAIEINPKDVNAYGNLAWLLATCSDSKVRDPTRAVQLAHKAVELEPKYGGAWNTLGVAQYRTGNLPEAIDALQKSEQLIKDDHYSYNGFFLSMAHWQLGLKDEAHQFYQKSVDWMQRNMPDDEALIRFRAETQKLLGIPTEAEKPEVRSQESGVRKEEKQ